MHMFPNVAVDVPAETTQEVQEAKISSYEEALAKIKDATGVSDIQEVVDRFLNQGETKTHLEQLKEENSRQLARLKEDREKMRAQFEDMKYSGEAKMSTYVCLPHACWLVDGGCRYIYLEFIHYPRGQRMLEEFETHLNEAKSKLVYVFTRAFLFSVGCYDFAGEKLVKRKRIALQNCWLKSRLEWNTWLTNCNTSKL